MQFYTYNVLGTEMDRNTLLVEWQTVMHSFFRILWWIDS